MPTMHSSAFASGSMTMDGQSHPWFEEGDVLMTDADRRETDEFLGVQLSELPPPSTLAQNMPEDLPSFPALLRNAHASNVKRCMMGLPAHMMGEAECARTVLGFYCLGTMDLLGSLNEQRDIDRESWREWLWEQQQTKGEGGSGFRTGTFMTPNLPAGEEESSDYARYDSPHMIMTYAALVALSMLRDDFSRLDRNGLLKFLKSCQKSDGSFSTIPGGTETDLRTFYCAFVICSLLDDWSAIDVEGALRYIESCRMYEGGYGESSYREGHGALTYIALACIHLAPADYSKHHLTTKQKAETTRWLLGLQHDSGGFCGRTGKDADACYCFWSSAALKILGSGDLLDSKRMAEFLASCQHRFGGIAKVPGEHADPFHTYLSLAALAMYPPQLAKTEVNAASWTLEPLDVLVNASESTARWAREHIPGPRP